ncbi:unnamed protein product [Heligmosomoides polygyrus]|uniref:COesterase domain-containing protein n=1 Tax=Heligmosomoides polygyrus TaxID=6339 RepID=A0A183FWL0_HELPZ|nr:unnamed protein product [Heligmosomoides polygyrus]
MLSHSRLRKSFSKVTTKPLSVPFAEPPTGEQRFRPPKPKKPWNETVVANTLSPACYQVNIFSICERN